MSGFTCLTVVHSWRHKVCAGHGRRRRPATPSGIAAGRPGPGRGPSMSGFTVVAAASPTGDYVRIHGRYMATRSRDRSYTSADPIGISIEVFANPGAELRPPEAIRRARRPTSGPRIGTGPAALDYVRFHGNGRHVRPGEGPSMSGFTVARTAGGGPFPVDRRGPGPPELGETTATSSELRGQLCPISRYWRGPRSGLESGCRASGQVVQGVRPARGSRVRGTVGSGPRGGRAGPSRSSGSPARAG